jgi:hypothetical protein
LRGSLLRLGGAGGRYGADVLAALECLTRGSPVRETVALGIDSLADGMILAQDLKTVDGVLILPRGLPINTSSREHIAAFAGRLEVDGIKVLAPVESLPEAPEAGAQLRLGVD